MVWHLSSESPSYAMLADSNFSKISKNVLIGNSSAVLLTPGFLQNVLQKTVYAWNSDLSPSCLTPPQREKL